MLADRTQTPSGPGYALENRRIVSRVFPQLIDDLRVRSPGGFFATLRDQLFSQVDDDEAPLAVVLTPGPFNETYFEHAYLARQLGLALVEGADLTVRGDTLYLKTFSGLRRVHAVFRRLDDDFCDPAELRADSALGVPGLLQVGACRPRDACQCAGQRCAGIGKLAGISAADFRMAVRRRTGVAFGRDVVVRRTAGAGTGNCKSGSAGHQAHLPESEVRTGVRQFARSSGTQRPDRATARTTLCLRRTGARVVVTVAGVGHKWTDGARAGHSCLRHRDTAGLSGHAGRSRENRSRHRSDVVSNQRGGGSKDVWVVAGEDASEESDVPVSTGRRRSRDEDLPSRLVENLFWMGRYAERCEDKARLMRATLAMETRSDSWKHASTPANISVCSPRSPICSPACSISTNESGVGGRTAPAGLVCHTGAQSILRRALARDRCTATPLP